MHGIVVGISESSTGAAALDWALEQAVLRKAPLTAIRAWDIPSVGGYYSVGDAMRSTSPDFELEERKIAQKALVKSCARVAGAKTVGTTAVTTRGRPPQVLVDAGRDAELVVVGSRGVGALSASCTWDR
jgi:nucleotide-binding universal stress UspA family protein